MTYNLASILGTTWSSILIGLLVIVVIYTIITILKARKAINELGVVASVPNKVNYPSILLLMLVVASGMVYLIKTGLEGNYGTLNYFLFAIFPYLSIVIFLIGSIYRYTAKGFKVSSLSSEFLERKKLFWGSQPFHWGLLFLFFGHLIAFLFPSSVLAWNGEPYRLLILEVTAFVFAISALIGLVLLIKRRLESKMLLVVVNKMDMLVYTILLLQIISGLGVAYFERWGSSWFASVLTPYLKSIFVLSPDISAVSAMPWMIQIHIFSAFAMIAIIPFTRFMHFLVAPIDYTWRGYQLVLWNWSRTAIRNSRQYFYGRKPQN